MCQFVPSGVQMCFALWPSLNSPGASHRDIEVCLEANQSKLFHMGIAAPPARSTLADALNLRDCRIYHALALRLISHARALYAEDPSVFGLDATVDALDSTTIDLCLSVFDWTPFRSTKAAIKLHTLLDLRGAIPAFIHISDGKLHYVKVLDILLIEAGSFYIMDRGYLDFVRLQAMHRAGAFFVTRAKENMDARRVYSFPVDRTSGIICDQRIMLNGCYSAEKYPDHLRRIRFNDPETGKTLVFLTNNTALSALTIVAFYKSRWQIELFFENTTWCTPSYVIEYQRAASLNSPLVGVLPAFFPPRIVRRPFSAVSMVRSHRFAWLAIVSTESAGRWS
jgi:hypothetical protein